MSGKKGLSFYKLRVTYAFLAEDGRSELLPTSLSKPQKFVGIKQYILQIMLLFQKNFIHRYTRVM